MFCIYTFTSKSVLTDTRSGKSKVYLTPSCPTPHAESPSASKSCYPVTSTSATTKTHTIPTTCNPRVCTEDTMLGTRTSSIRYRKCGSIRYRTCGIERRCMAAGHQGWAGPKCTSVQAPMEPMKSGTESGSWQRGVPQGHRWLLIAKKGPSYVLSKQSPNSLGPLSLVWA